MHIWFVVLVLNVCFSFSFNEYMKYKWYVTALGNGIKIVQKKDENEKYKKRNRKIKE